MSEPTVLVTDDERDVADVYALHLDREYDTRVAYGGQEALKKLDSSVDVTHIPHPSAMGDQFSFWRLARR